MKTELKAHLAQFTAAPILFVGSGVSRRYLGLPDWDGLLRQLAGLAGKPYEYYRSSAGSDLGKTASLMAGDLHDHLWDDRRKALREKYTNHLQTPESAIKILAAEACIGVNFTRSPALKKEIAAFGEIVVDAVITTNYDTLVQQVFPDYRVFVGQDELIFADPTGVGEIYHIHGSLTQPNTMVLTHDDYDLFNERNPYLIAKLLTIFAEHPVIFLGYSLNDPNIINTLTSLATCLKRENITKLQDRLIVVEWQSGSSPSMSSTVVPVSGGISIPVQRIVVPDYLELFGVLSQVQRKFNAHLLRQLKERLVEIVLTNDAQGRLYVQELTKSSLSDDVEVVFGVGAIEAVKSYAPISRYDLIHDLLHDDRGLNAKLVVLQSMPALLKAPGNFPMAKYLRAAGYLDSKGKLVRKDELDPKLVRRYEEGATRYLPTSSVRKAAAKAVQTQPTFGSLRDHHPVNDVLAFLGALPPGKVRKKMLRDYLLLHESTFIGGPVGDSNFVKAICLLDRLLYGPDPAW